MKAFLMARRVALLGVLILAACAGGGETGTGITQTGGGKDASVGTITAFGSVWVNGVEFETPATQVTVEGAVSSTDALRLGMVVTVKGTINADKVSGIADLSRARSLFSSRRGGDLETFLYARNSIAVSPQLFADTVLPAYERAARVVSNAKSSRPAAN